MNQDLFDALLVFFLIQVQIRLIFVVSSAEVGPESRVDSVHSLWNMDSVRWRPVLTVRL